MDAGHGIAVILSLIGLAAFIGMATSGKGDRYSSRDGGSGGSGSDGGSSNQHSGRSK